jgi:hypothetical protein
MYRVLARQHPHVDWTQHHELLWLMCITPHSTTTRQIKSAPSYDTIPPSASSPPSPSSSPTIQRPIHTSHTPRNKSGLCEYSATECPVDPQEHVNSIPLRQLIYICGNTIEMTKSFKRAPNKTQIAYLDRCKPPTQGRSQHANHTTVSLFINRPLQPQEDLIIQYYGGPYWQIFQNHLSLDQQRQIKIQYPDITFPPPLALSNNTLRVSQPKDLQPT